MVNEKEFWVELFTYLWNDLRVNDVKPLDIRSAVDLLMRASRLDTEHLAMRVGVMAANVKAILVTGRAKPDLLKELSKVALEYDMPILAEWFTYKAGSLILSKQKKQTDRWSR